MTDAVCGHTCATRMKHMIQKMYSVDRKSGERKKLKRQSTLPSSDDTMNMTDISQNSLLCGMQEFDKAVQNMEKTILVPSRLMDMSVADDCDAVRPRLPTLLRSSDAYDVFQLVKSVREQVRRGGVGGDDSGSTSCGDQLQGQLRRQSTTLSSHSLSSLASDGSGGGSAGGSADSGLEATEDDRPDADDRCERARAEFTSHLSGLAKCLAQMTEAATYLSGRYEHQLNSGF